MTKISAVHDDITRLAVDAIVNAASPRATSSTLWARSGTGERAARIGARPRNLRANFEGIGFPGTSYTSYPNTRPHSGHSFRSVENLAPQAGHTALFLLGSKT